MLVDYGMCVSACLRLISPDHVVDTWLCCLNKLGRDRVIWLLCSSIECVSKIFGVALC